MKIIKIEAKEGVTRMVSTDDNRKLIPVTVTVKNCLGKTRKFDAFPTNYGPTYWSKSILYFIFVDEFGKELEREVCQQINNWIQNQNMLGLLNTIN